MPGEYRPEDILDEVARMNRSLRDVERELRKRPPIKNLGNISGKTSAQLDGMFSRTPGDGTFAVGDNAGAPVLLRRYNGKWYFSGAMTQIA